MRRLLVRGGLFFVACLFAAVVLELGVRQLAPQQLIEFRPDIWIPDHEGLGWRQREGIDTNINTGERRLATGDHGHRSAPSAAGASDPAVRVLALGDSFTVGLQVEYEDLFTARLEHALSREAGRGVEVVNTAVGEWGPSHYLLEARGELERGAYGAVLVALFAGNDIERKRIDRFAPRQGQLIHRLRLPRALRTKELVGALAYPLNDTLERRSRAFVLGRTVLWRRLMRMGLSARSLPDSLFRTEAHSARWAVTAGLVADVAAVAKQHGATTVVCLIPGAYQVGPELALDYARAIGVDPAAIDPDQPGRLLGTELQRFGIELFDLLPSLRVATAPDLPPLYGRVDTHLAPRGHEIVAGTLAAPLAGALAAAQSSPE